MLRLILLVALLVTPAICCAEIYKWVNEKGVISFADDLGKVPEKYRGKAVPVDKVEQAVEVLEKSTTEKEPRKKDDARQEQKPAADNVKDKAAPLFDGKEGSAWKRDFGRQKYEITSLEEQAAGIKGRMANPGNISRGEYLTLQNTARDLEVRLSIARKKLEALDEAANRAELPAEFR